jgi:putative Ca2+/H+ antiporter (TMEM165/GDT1 family)
VASPFLTPLCSSFLLATASEFGDKTQLLSASLNLRYGKPWQILIAATLASAANHLVVAMLGQWIGPFLGSRVVAIVMMVVFVGLAGITLFAPEPRSKSHQFTSLYSFWGVFLIILLVEMGDKSQLVTAALAARYNSTYAVALGSSLGTILPDAAAIFLAQKMGSAMQWKQLRFISAGAFLVSAVILAL